MTSTRTLLFLAVSVVIYGGCTSDPRAYPYVLHEEYDTYTNEYPVDVDGDGRDEFVRVQVEGDGDGRLWTVALRTGDERSVDQVNFDHQIVSSPLVVDFGNDGREEILVAVCRNDSLYLVQTKFDLAAHDVTTENWYYVASGEAVKREGVTYPWDPRVGNVYLTQSSSGTPILSVVVTTQYAGYPRGIVNLSGQNFKDRDELFVGAKIGSHHRPEDYDGNGTLDLILKSYSSDNGHSYNGFTDSLSYLFAVQLDPLEIIWSKQVGGNGGSSFSSRLGNFSGSGSHEIATFISRTSTPSDVTIRDARTGEVIRNAHHEVAINQLRALPFGLDEDKVVFHDIRGRLYILSHASLKASMLLDGGVDGFLIGPDIDGDGNEDIYVNTQVGVKIFSGTGKAIAFIPGRQPNLNIIAGDIGFGRQQAGKIMFGRPGRRIIYSARANPWYPVFRYWPVFAIFAVIGIMVSPLILTRRLALYQNQARTLASDLAEQHARIQSLEGMVNELQTQAVGGVLPTRELSFPMQIKQVLDDYALDSSFDVDKFAGKLGYSTRQTIRKVKAATGKSPNEVIWLYRIEYAKSLLTESDTTIADVSDQSGFKSQSHFSTKFYELVGVKPTEFRKSVCA